MRRLDRLDPVMMRKGSSLQNFFQWRGNQRNQEERKLQTRRHVEFEVEEEGGYSSKGIPKRNRILHPVVHVSILKSDSRIIHFIVQDFTLKRGRVVFNRFSNLPGSAQCAFFF